MTYYEESLKRDIERIRTKITEMGHLSETALRSCLRALQERNRQLAYSVILRDQRIDELEKEVDRLCLEFILRQQPVAGTLRFAYAAIKINADLERVGDYAESMARHLLTWFGMQAEVPYEGFAEIASHAIPMLHDAVKAFVDQDPELAKRTMEREDLVDRLRHSLNEELVKLHKAQQIPIEALTPLMTIVNRFERAADQARSICQEVHYMCTGQYSKHAGTEVFRMLFVDEHNSCRSQMAEAIGNALKQPKFIFSSAGLTARPIDPATVSFLKEKGIDAFQQAPKAVDQVPHIEHYQIIVALAKEAQRVFPPPPTKVVSLDWSVRDPSTVTGTPAEIHAAYEETFQFLRGNIKDLVEAILVDK